MNISLRLIIFPALVGFGSFYAGTQYISQANDAFSSSYGETREDSSRFSFTNPLLECSFGPDYITKNDIKPSKKSLEDLISKNTSTGDITHASVYYRDLNNGPWLGINERETFFPASLMKVPLAMHFYKQSEGELGLLDKVIEPNKDLDTVEFGQYFKPSKSIDTKIPHTIQELIDASITYSDNRATEALVFSMNKNGLDTLLNDLHLRFPESSVDDFINVKDYATFFRVLFNASYLSQHNSEELLTLLSRTDFHDGITKYLPKDIVISHKFGEKLSDFSNIKQFHDCGIVYVPYHPYLVCIMVRGTHMNKNVETVALLSQMIYQDVKKQAENKP
jgi:beta-lactamase class A